MRVTGRSGAVLVVHDDDWQTPAITERNAYRCAAERLPSVPDVAYLAFPWATLIDLIVHKQDASRLLDILEDLGRETRRFGAVVTVCQHIFMGDFPDLFAKAGVTHLFWSHLRNDGAPRGFEAVAVAPFPLYPVNAPARDEVSARPRHLFSYIGTRPGPLYLDNVRRLIVDELSDSPSGYVRERADWHFYRAVYEKQIYASIDTVEDPLANAEAVEYRAVMADSLFALCPSGTGPNSLRLWEAITAGVIPVVLSPHYQPPGEPRLWSSAIISADGNRETIRSLPQRLARIAADDQRIHATHSALALMRARYGADTFVHDIVRLYRDLQRDEAGTAPAVAAGVSGHRPS